MKFGSIAKVLAECMQSTTESHSGEVSLASANPADLHAEVLAAVRPDLDWLAPSAWPHRVGRLSLWHLLAAT